jgi:hypothetical protein
MIAAIEDGLYQPSMKSRMEELERQKAELTARLAEASGKGPDILPNGCGMYLGREDYPAARPNRGEIDATLHGDLRTILGRLEAQAMGRLQSATPLRHGGVGFDGCGGAQPPQIGLCSECLAAAALILVHNRPSGDPKPSRDDIEMTKEIRRASEALGISIHDHLVIGRKGHASFRSLGLI